MGRGRSKSTERGNNKNQGCEGGGEMVGEGEFPAVGCRRATQRKREGGRISNISVF